MKKKFPQVMKHYSVYKLLETSYYVLSEKTFLQREVILTENKINKHIFIVKSGHITLSKKVTYYDIHEEPVTNQVELLTIGEGEIIGEQSIIDIDISKFRI